MIKFVIIHDIVVILVLSMSRLVEDFVLCALPTKG